MDEAFTGRAAVPWRRHGQRSTRASAPLSHLARGDRAATAHCACPTRSSRGPDGAAELDGSASAGPSTSRARRCCSCGKSRTSSPRRWTARPPRCRSRTAVATPRRSRRCALLRRRWQWADDAGPSQVLWRLLTPEARARPRSVLPGGPPVTLAFFVDISWTASRTTTRWTWRCSARTTSSERCSKRGGRNRRRSERAVLRTAGRRGRAHARQARLRRVGLLPYGRGPPSLLRPEGRLLPHAEGVPRYSDPALQPPSHRSRARRPPHRGRRRAGDGAVDDDDRHRRCRRHRPAVHRAVGSRLGDGARHGQRARGGGRGARDQAAHARRRLHRAADRRLPLQRPPAADALSRLRGGARQVPHQPRQRRHRQAARRAVLHHLPGRHRSRQAGAHRRQRRLAQPGTGDGEDAGEHRPQPRPQLRRHHQRVHGALGAAVDRARPRDRAARGPDHHLVQGVAARAT